MLTQTPSARNLLPPATIASRVRSVSARTLRIAFAMLALLFVVSTALAVPVDDTWDGDTDTAWGTGTNWVTNPADVDVPGTGNTATFSGAGNGNTTIDLGAGVTIDHINFNDAGTASYTIGDGAVGSDTLTFDNGGGIDTNAALDADQTIAADIILGDGTAANTFRIDTESTTNRVIITGDIDTGPGAGTGVQRLEIGDLGGASGGRTVQIDGDIFETGSASRIELFVGGADLIMNGNVNQVVVGDNTQRTIIRDTATATVNAGGSLGEGLMDIRNGTLNLDTDAQAFRDLLNLGHGTQGNGPATLNIGALNTLELRTTLTYIDDSVVANTGTVAGGTLQITGGNRTIIFHDNTAIAATSPELTITSTITNDGSDRDLVLRGMGNGDTSFGTIRIDPSGTANSFGGVTLQAGTLQLGAGGLSSEGDFLTLAAWNSTNFVADAVATVDLMGTTHALGNGTGTAGVGGNLTLGGGGTTNIADNGFMPSVVDTVGGGKLTNVNQIIYNKGTGTGIQRNGAATISADIDFDTSGTNKSITIQDGEAVTDLTISGALNTTGLATHDFTFLGDGTLSFSGSLGFGGTVGAHDVTTFNNQKTVLGTGTGSNVGGTDIFLVAQRNNATFSDFDVELDINGETVVLQDGLTIGANGSGSVATQSNVSITDSAGGGLIQLTGLEDGNRTLKYENGTGGANLQATIDPNLLFTNPTANFTGTINVEDGADTVDLILNGTLMAQRLDTLALRGFNKSGTGTLQINSTGNSALYTTMNIQAGTLRIAGDGSLGNNDVLIGNNNNTSTLDYFGAGETINNQTRIGDNTNTANTRTGGAVILNSGTGTVTFSAATFNQANGNIAATSDRDLAFGGVSDIVVSGIIQDNVDGVSTVSLTKNDANTLILNGANTFTGPITVNDGTLGGTTGSLNASAGTLTVASGATLAPGPSGTGIDTFTHNASALLDVGSTYAVELASFGSGPGIDNDLLDLTAGSATVDGTVKPIFVSPFVADHGDFFDVITAATGSVTLGSGYVLDTSMAVLPANLQFHSFIVNGGTTLRLVVVPEPGTLLLLTLAGVALLPCGRRRRRGRQAAPIAG